MSVDGKKICFIQDNQACPRYRPEFERILANLPFLELTTMLTEADYILMCFCAEEDVCFERAAYNLRVIEKIKKPEAKLIVAGCGANIIGEELLRGIECVDYVVVRRPLAMTVVREVFGKETCENKYKILPGSEGTFFFEIGNGCFKECGACNFCFNSVARIPLRSKPMNHIIEAISWAVEHEGAKRITIGSLNTTNYGVDFPDKKPKLHILLQEISKIEGVEEIIVDSITVCNMYTELLEEVCTNSKILSVQIGIQSGSDKMHKIMNTGFNVAECERIFEKLNKAGKMFRSNFIFGHPCETQDDFKKTIELIKENWLWLSNICLYNKVKGSPSAKMEQVPKKVKARRTLLAKSLCEGYVLKHHKMGQIIRTYKQVAAFPEEIIRHKDNSLGMIFSLACDPTILLYAKVTEEVANSMERGKCIFVKPLPKVVGPMCFLEVELL